MTRRFVAVAILTEYNNITLKTLKQFHFRVIFVRFRVIFVSPTRYTAKSGQAFRKYS